MTAPQKSSFKFKFSRGAAAAGLAAVLVGCGGGGSETAQDNGGENPPPNRIEAAKTALQNAILAANGLTAGTDTATQLAAWQMVKDKAEELQAAVQSNNGSAADLMTATTALGNANTNITPLAQSMERITTASNALMGAISAYDATASDTEKRTAQEAIKDAAANLITVLQTEGGTTAQVQDATMKQTAADVEIRSLTISITRTDLNEALTALNTDTPTNAQVTAAREALTDFEEAIAHLSESDKATHSSTITSANTTIGIAETLIVGNNLDDINEENEVWEDAIDEYTVSNVAGDIDNNLNGTRQPTIEFENNAVNIELRNNSNGILIPSTSMTAPTGMTASRFTIQEDRSRGGIATSFSQEAAQRTYANYFFITYDPAANNGAGDFDRRDNPISGLAAGSVQAAENSGGALTVTNAARFTPAFFGGTRPTSLLAGGSQSVTFLGVNGSIACAAACDVVIGGDNRFTFSSDVIFTPAIPANNNLNDVIVTDITAGSTEFVAFGYWLNSAGAGSNLRHTIDTYAAGFGFANNNAFIPAADVDNARVGRATYSGGALGFYVLDGEGNGEFAADANLVAQFEDNTGNVPEAEKWLLSGTIGNFQSATTPGHDLSGWSIGLAADFGVRDPATNTIQTGRTDLSDFRMTGQGNATGEWVAAVYGTNAPIDAGTDERLDIQAIVGEFNASFSNGHAVGAFGTERD